jgi:hypothetical protein
VNLLRAFFAALREAGWIALRDARLAQERGAQLLQANLTKEQLRQLHDLAYFEVVGGTSKTLYRIHDCSMINVEQLDENNRPVCKWCFAPIGNLVRGDVLLAQKLALELFETEALVRANSYPTYSHDPHARS